MKHKYYSTFDRVISTVTAILVLIALIEWGIVIYRKVTTPSPWIGSYPMANQHIEWTWAGRETK